MVSYKFLFFIFYLSGPVNQTTNGNIPPLGLQEIKLLLMFIRLDDTYKISEYS